MNGFKLCLLYWIFKHLKDRHPEVLEDMVRNFNNDKWAPDIASSWTRRQSLLERYNVFLKEEENK